MNTIGIEELAEMAQCRSALEIVLRQLDAIGAGIAAIHVDAAIAQLQGNIEIGASRAGVRNFDPELLDVYVVPPIRH